MSAPPGECCTLPLGAPHALTRACAFARLGAPRVFTECPNGIGVCVFHSPADRGGIASFLWLLAEVPWSRADEYSAKRLAQITARGEQPS